MALNFAARFSILLSSLLIVQTGGALAQGNRETDSQANASGRRIAINLPKHLRKTELTQTQALTAVKNAAGEVETVKGRMAPPQPQIPARSTQIPENLKEALIDGATKAEVLSRSYNRHIADLIVWVASCMSQSTNFTPVSGPTLKKQFPLESHPFKQDGRQEILQID